MKGLHVILDASLRLFAPWLVMVLIVTRSGYPGVVCVTPMAWLLALPVGLRVESTSTSTEPAHRLKEAAFAGAFLGLLQGILFLLIVPRMGPIAPDELAGAIGISLVMFVLGVPAAAGLSVFTAWLSHQRK